DLSGYEASSHLRAFAGGVLQTPALASLDGVLIDEDAANSISTSQITAITDGYVDFTGPVVYDLGNVTDLTHTTVKVAGAGRSISFPKATTINGASFYVSGGAHLSVPTATGYSHAATGFNQVRTFQA